jgi:hypothetical protein
MGGGNGSQHPRPSPPDLASESAGRCRENGQNDDNGNGRRSAMSGTSATVVTFKDHRGGRRMLYFTRAELNQLLSLYSRNVASGIWRDYAIDHRDGQALFSVFRHTHENAAYTIVKSLAPAANAAEFVVLSGRQRLRAARSLPEALDYFRSKLTLVSANPA